MIFRHDNLFCQPTPSLLDATATMIEWSLDGVTWQSGGAPANTQIYLRVTAARDFSDATFIKASSALVNPVFAAIGSYGVVTAQTTPSGIAADVYSIQVLQPSGNFDAGSLTFA